MSWLFPAVAIGHVEVVELAGQLLYVRAKALHNVRVNKGKMKVSGFEYDGRDNRSKMELHQSFQMSHKSVYSIVIVQSNGPISEVQVLPYLLTCSRVTLCLACTELGVCIVPPGVTAITRTLLTPRDVLYTPTTPGVEGLSGEDRGC